MKRLIRIIFIASVLVLAAASANAKTYTVKPGDNLSKIGKMYHLTWQAIAKANADKISDPDRIYAGQKLQIPAKGKNQDAAKAKSKKKEIRIKSLGVKPFGRKRDTIKAIKKSKKIINEVKDLLIAKYKSGNFSWSSLKKGDRREEMFYGDYKILTNVVMDFPEGHHEAVRDYSVEHDGWIFHLEIPLKCYNPILWKEKIFPPSPVEPEPLPEPEPELELSPPPAKKQLLMMLIPPPEEEEPEAQPEIPLSLPPVVEEKWQPDFEVWAYAGSYRGVQSNNSHDWNLHKGGNISLFPYQFKFDGAIFRLGPSYQWVDWKGEIRDIIKYSGKMSLVGGEAQYITGSSKSQLKMYYGKKTDDIDGRGDLAAFRSRQWNHVLAVEPSYQWWQDSGKKWFTEVEVGARLEFDLEGDKNSSFNGARIDDPRTGQGVFLVRGKTDVYKFYNDNAVLTLQLAPGYEQSPKTWFMEPRVGLKFFEIAEPALSYKWDEGSQNDLVAGHIVLNVGELIKRVWWMFKAKQKEGGEKSK